MSKLAKKPIIIPEKVKLELNNNVVKVTGPLGTLDLVLKNSNFVEIKLEDKKVLVNRTKETREGKMFQGLCYAMIRNMIKGVTEGYKKVLEIVGVGYQAQLQGNKLIMKLGFSHPVEFVLPSGIKATLDPKGVEITITGIDKYLVGETAAKIRRIKPPEPYKGTGIKYKDEHIIRKLGKAAIAGAGGGSGGAKK
ncbi:MAG: 50S ribosomal protein L6 [Endomicrobiia bacterium]